MAGVSKALLKGKRGIMIDYARASVPEIIRHAAGMQGLSVGTIAMLAGIERQRFYSMLSGAVGIQYHQIRPLCGMVFCRYLPDRQNQYQSPQMGKN